MSCVTYCTSPEGPYHSSSREQHIDHSKMGHTETIMKLVTCLDLCICLPSATCRVYKVFYYIQIHLPIANAVRVLIVHHNNNNNNNHSDKPYLSASAPRLTLWGGGN
jgi:hypothetical protein